MMPTRCCLPLGGVVLIHLLAWHAPAQDFGTSMAKTFETLTFSLDNSTFDGNPFDLDATVLFTHSDTGEQIRTGMYYDGGTTWRFRFTGTRAGIWTFTSQSDDTDLTGVSGTIDVSLDPSALGFLTTHGTKYARQLGSDESLTAQPYVVYMNRRSDTVNVNPGFGGDTDIVGTWRGQVNADRRTAYIDQARSNGANAIFLHVNNQWFRRGALGWDDHNSTDPDRSVFAAIEDLIVDAHQLGVQVHIWAWGDNASLRRWTPLRVAGGLNGDADRRVQRYIADRLGPLPGWSMGYGFDLFEWTNQQQVSDWANFLTDRMGWDHLLSARGLPLLGPDGKENSAPPTFVDGYASLRRNGQVLQTDSNAVSGADDGGPDRFLEAREDVLNDPARAILYEERHAYQRYWAGGGPAWPTTSMDGTRKLVWWWTMAGGAGGWIGFYDENSTASGDGPYPNPEQLQTHHTFWADRFELDMEVNNDLTGGPQERQYALQSPSTGAIVVFAEDADSIRLNLSDFPHDFQAVLVDTEAAYAEIGLGQLAPTTELIDLTSRGRPRDWAVALTPIPEPTTKLLGLAGGLLLLCPARHSRKFRRDRLWDRRCVVITPLASTTRR